MAEFKKITDIKKLKIIANKIRQNTIKALLSAASGHSAGPLGFTDIFTVIYFNILKHDPKNPNWENRDFFLLSHGHICPGLYATMAEAGYFPIEELWTLRKLGSRLQGHPHRTSLPGLESSSGPLGAGLSQSAGIAYALRMDKKKNRVYCATSDGEHNEGLHWEAVLFCGKYKLNNLVCIVDRNNIQIDGHTEDIMPLEPLKEKYLSFNWHVIEIDGHNIQQIINAFKQAEAVYEKPVCIIAHTIPGKGVSFMENDPEWHGKPPTKEQAEIALKELQVQKEKIENNED